MASRLDQLVKGAPSEDTKPPEISPIPKSYLEGTVKDGGPSSRPSTPDPLSTLPSSPPQIYLNLLILESSLRAQYLALRERRRQNTFFLTLLTLWVAYFSYALFLRPREDGRGVGGSVYWVVEMAEKVALMGGIVTGILIWGTGQWERGVRWPRRWLAVANRGLRGMNTKIVVIRGPWWRELLSYVSFMFPTPSLWYAAAVPGSSYHLIQISASERRAVRQNHTSYDDAHGAHAGGSHDDTELGLIEEDLAPGGDYIRLLLLSKAFSPEFRDNWDTYRSDYWEKENDRRAKLRRKLLDQEREWIRQHGGWFWWLPGRHRNYQRLQLGGSSETPAAQSHHHPHQHSHHSPSSSTNPASGKPADSKSRRLQRSDSQSHHSRNSSRSATPVDGTASTPSESGSMRRKKLSSKASLSRVVGPLTNTSSSSSGRDNSRPSTPASTISDDSLSLVEREKGRELEMHEQKSSSVSAAARGM
jgi:uncharacterized membrane protein (DUF485 family)